MYNPEFVEIDGKRFKINTDFRYAIRCNEIAEDTTINEFERATAIIYTLFGDEGLYATKYHQQLLEKADKYLLCGKERENKKDEPVMDYIKDMDYIEASFQSDYNIDLENVNMHWWKFNNLINGLSNSELGNCCILNQIINIRMTDIKKIEDKKEREKMIELKEKYALKKNKKQPTEKQQESANDFFAKMGWE